MFIGKRISLFLFLLTALFASVQGHVLADDSLEGAILNQVSGIQAVAAADLQLVNLETRTYALTGTTGYQAKVLNRATDELYGLLVDPAGQILDGAALAAAEQAAYTAQYGRLEAKLSDQLEMMAADDTITVAVWLLLPELPAGDRPAISFEPEAENGPAVAMPPATQIDGSDKDLAAALAAQRMALHAGQSESAEDLAALQAAHSQQLRAQIDAVQTPFIAAMADIGISPDYVSESAPIVYLTVSKTQVEILNQRADIDTIYGPNENFDLMDVAKPAQKANVVDSFGYDGAGISVAILEDSRIQFANPYLFSGTTRVPGDPNVDDHATATAGMVASQHSTQQGIAQGVSLLSANGTSYSDANISAAMDWAAITQNADIINNSWGGNTGTTAFNVHDRHLDYIVRHYWSTVTVAAGNEGNASDRVTSPARGYNVISVGNFSDGGSISWDNDVMNGSSSTINPSSGMEKPEVAAAGSSITSTTMNSPWTGNVGSGTSYAAPMVAGEAALLMERNSSLEIRPEAVKAIIMASALNNIEGSSRLSGADGAGGVDMHAAFRIVDEGWWAWRAVDSTDFPISYYVYAYAGETVRAVISWDSDPNGSYTSDPLDADIDLRVYAPNGSYQTGSLSVANSFEIVEFTAATTGNHELRISDFTFNGSIEYLGVAWWKGHNAMAPFVSTGWGTPPVGRDYFRAAVGNDWNIIALRPPSTADYDLYFYGDSAFGDPDDHDLLASSTYVNNYVDYVLVDSNQAANGDYYPEVRTYSGTGTYRVEWSSSLANMTTGSYGPYTMGSLDVALVWDSYQTAGVEKHYALEPISGSGDLGMALYDSTPGNTSSYYPRRSQYVAYSDATGSSVEAFSRQQADSDWTGLAVFNKSGSTTFYLHVDETAPTGAINIAGGAAAVNSTLVTLNLAASDVQTGVKAMRLSNNGISWTAWQPFSSSSNWLLPAGNGPKTVYVQFMNKANMVSPVYSDAILLDMTAPTSTVTSPAIVGQNSFPVSWSGTDSGSGIAGYDVQYRLASGGGWVTWLTNTSATTATFGPVVPVTVQQGETYQFRVRARDVAGNVEAYPAVPDSETFVLYRLYLPVSNRP